MEQYQYDQLIIAVAHGDMRALEILYNDCAKGVYAVAFSIVRSHCAAEDIMQDTFVRVTRSAYAFRSQGNGRAWIFRIARNLALNHVSRSNSNSLEAMIEQSGKEPQSSLTTEDSALSNVALNQAMLTLSEQEREIVYMHSVAGLKLSEIARVLDVPLGTVKWRHTGALKKLRAALSE